MIIRNRTPNTSKTKASPSPTSIEQATPISVKISPERARTHIGDPATSRQEHDDN
jgi:hypothetical protein